MSGRVYLVGAGCGRADLITLRGKERLGICDAVVYDDLIDPALLDFAPAGAERIYMGKRRGAHSAPQADISARLVELARRGKLVVRLKGGDPFVFGRGGEEAAALRGAGIPFEVVPGISSAVAIPREFGIPVTHRGVSRSFHVITGHTAGDGLPPDLPKLARLEGTLVFLMGLKHLPDIARGLIEGGRSPDTPAAVLSGGNTPHPAAVRGTLADIGEKALRVLPPAVIVVGETAALDFSSTLPLSGVRVGVTGTPSITQTLSAHLSPLGADVYPLAQMAVEELPADLGFLALPGPKWLVFTSPNGVEAFFRRMRAQKLDLRALAPCSFAAIGPATGAALEGHGIFPDLCPGTHTSAALAEALVDTVPPEHPVYLLRSARGAEILKTRPEGAGLSVTDIALYTTRPRSPGGGELPNGLHYLIFASAGGVGEFFRQYDALPEAVTPVCIGPVTAAELARHTGRMPLLARDTSAGALVAVILENAEKNPHIP